MGKVMALCTALALVVSVGWSPDAFAQAQQPSAPAQKPAAPAQQPAAPGGTSAPAAEKAKEVEGKIKSIRASAKSPTMMMVTLEDGTQLALPKDVKPQKGALKQGAIVKATYEEKDGQKVVTAIEVKS